MKHWLKIIVISLVMFAGIGVAVNLAGCVSDQENAANQAYATTLHGKIDASSKSEEEKAALHAQLADAEKASREGVTDPAVEAGKGLLNLVPIPGAAVLGAIAAGVYATQRGRRILAGVTSAVDIILKDDPAVAAAFAKNKTKLHAVMGADAVAAVKKARKKNDPAPAA